MQIKLTEDHEILNAYIMYLTKATLFVCLFLHPEVNRICEKGNGVLYYYIYRNVTKMGGKRLSTIYTSIV